MRRAATIDMGSVGSIVWKLTRLWHREQPVSLEMEQKTALPPSEIIARIADVRSEPIMIPFVRSVEVLRESTQSIEYNVRGSVFGLPWWVHYVKQWDYNTFTASWRSIDASYGLENTGQLSVVRDNGRSTIKLTTGYSAPIPKVGGTIERIMKAFLAYTFGVWLYRLSR